MPYYNSAAKPVIVYASILILLFSSVPIGHAVLQPVITGLLNVSKILFSGSLFCSPDGNLPPGSGSLGAVGTLVAGSCNGGSGDIGTIVYNFTGFFQALRSLPLSVLLNSTQGMPCNFVVKLPVTGTTCTLFPPRGILNATVELLDVIVNAAGETTAVVRTLPWQYVP